jgi:hypothetical protein
MFAWLRWPKPILDLLRWSSCASLAGGPPLLIDWILVIGSACLGAHSIGRKKAKGGAPPEPSPRELRPRHAPTLDMTVNVPEHEFRLSLSGCSPIGMSPRNRLKEVKPTAVSRRFLHQQASFSDVFCATQLRHGLRQHDSGSLRPTNATGIARLTVSQSECRDD